MCTEKGYKILFVLFMGVLLLPVILQVTHIPPIRPLHGYTEPVEKVRFNARHFLDGSLQHYLDESAAAEFGGRGFYVRCYNQLFYTCFHQISNNTIVEGKNGELFLRNYLDDISGVTLKEKFGSVDSAKRAAKENVARTLELIDSLKAHNIQLLIVLAPSKPAIYPEWLPDSTHPAGFSLQREYARLFKQYHIPYLDFVPLFNTLKTSEKYPLYTRYGTHWSYGTIPFVADTLLRAIEHSIGTPMPYIQLIDSNITRRYYGSDVELEHTCNLTFPLRHPLMPTPKFALRNIPPKDQRPDLLVVADSYFTQLENSPFTEAFGNIDYWKYNETSYSKIPERQNKIPYIDRYAAITDADVVVVMFTTIFAYDYLFGFLETALKTFDEGDIFNDGQYVEDHINMNIKRIKNDPEWLKKVEEQAKENHVPLEQSLRGNAQYAYEMDFNKR